MKISLCIITGNEECHATRFFESFGPAFDELCIVRAIGNQQHDRTLSLAKEYCEKNGKSIKIGEYRNEGWSERIGYDAPVADDNPATWKHVDDFAAARNQAWKMATGDWQFWADMDDVLAPGSAEGIRTAAVSGKSMVYFFKYAIRNSGETNIRERLFKTGLSEWSQPLHENCNPYDREKYRGISVEGVTFSHEPQIEKPRDPRRNLRILSWNLRRLDAFAFELHREYFYLWQFDKKPENAEKSKYWAEIAQKANTLADQRYDMLLNVAKVVESEDIIHSMDLCWSAIRIQPARRDAWGDLAEYELKKGNAARASLHCRIMQGFKKPRETGFPMPEKYYSWQGFLLATRAMRANGQEAEALASEKAIFEKHERRISLLHATRGRPQQAIQARWNFFAAAGHSLGIEHIFAIDEDDAVSLKELAHYRHVVVKNPNGCVKAWNEAAKASSGQVLVQMSDDWLPAIQWDEAVWEAFSGKISAINDSLHTQWVMANEGTPFENRIPFKPVTIGDVPLVLHVNDGHRTDGLMCMAILTRKRYEDQGGELFSSEYFGVFSDNEFSFRAYRDRIVVDGKHIHFRHQHPIFEGKPVDQWDETHRRQNAPERYAEGEAIFRRRNPDAP